MLTSMDFLAFFDSAWTGPGVLTGVALMVITRCLVWFTDLRRAEARADRLEKIVWELLGATKDLTIQAEATNEFLTHLPTGERE